jgi:RNA polymerase sigma-70 factor (ECF subfamily)
VRNGDTSSYEILAIRYARPLHRIAWRLLRNEADAEDAVQSAHLMALKYIHQYRGSGYFQWMYSIVKNEAHTKMRKGKRLVSIGDAYPAYLSSKGRNPEEQVVDRDLEDTLERAVEHLPAAFQPVFQLCEVEEMTAAETAERLGLSGGCVKTRLFRAKHLLRRRLKTVVRAVDPERRRAAA